jgi:hypothetical protein
LSPIPPARGVCTFVGRSPPEVESEENPMYEHVAQAATDNRPVVRLTLEGEQGELLALLRKLVQPTKVGRRPRKLSAGAVEEILRRLAAGEAKAALAREFSVSVQTIRRVWQNRMKEV